MKRKLPLAVSLFCALFALHATGHGSDALGTSDAELARLRQLNTTHKVTPLSDAELKQLMVGKWTTGRHEYEYKPDGTWRMLPADTATKGTWHIQNHQLIEDTGARTIMEASHQQIVLKNDQGAYPFRYRRIEKAVKTGPVS